MLKKIKNSYFPRVIIWIIFIWLLGGILIRYIEPESFDSLKTSFWWAIVSMTTVGYGDKFPVTTGGRFMAMFVMVVGLGVFDPIDVKVIKVGLHLKIFSLWCDNHHLVFFKPHMSLFFFNC